MRYAVFLYVFGALSWASSVHAQSEGAEAAPEQPPTEAVVPEQQPASVAPAHAGTTEVAELVARVQALERIEPLDDSVQRPVDFAKAALDRSRASAAAGDVKAEARTRKLALAAVELAEARLELLRERALVIAVRARLAHAAQEHAQAKHAVERERARALELKRASAAP